MGWKGTKQEKKEHYDKKLCDLLDEYPQIFICIVSNSLHSVSLFGKAADLDVCNDSGWNHFLQS
jgi:hypothetical protein